MIGTVAPPRPAGAAAWLATGPESLHNLAWGDEDARTLWEDLQDLLRRTKADFDPTSAQARAAWQAPMPAGAGVAGHA